MQKDLNKLEQNVESELQILRALPTARPSPAAVERTRQAVRAAALRRQAALRLYAFRQWVGVAAALVLAIGWGLGPGAARMTAAETEAVLDAWGHAFDASGVWLNEVAANGEGYVAAELDDEFDLLFWTLEQSFDALNPL